MEPNVGTSMSTFPKGIQTPTKEKIDELATIHYFDLTPEEIGIVQDSMSKMLDNYNRLDELEPSIVEFTHTDRNPGYRPDRDEDPHNAIVTKCNVQGSGNGLLHGKDIGLKDNIAVAGVEMTCGSDAMRGYIPNRDATVVKRMLDAGGNIVAKLNMTNMAFSGSGEPTAKGPVLNPHDTDYLAGGSSSGSGVAVANDDVDIALGADQGGSIRIPASWCGCVGLKPTHGLVPYTGIMGLGPSRDHVGPITKNVEDCALVMETIAGKDGNDMRQTEVKVGNYSESLNEDVEDITIGVLDEGFQSEFGQQAVNDSVRNAMVEFEDNVGFIDTVSIPEHLDGPTIWRGIGLEETAAFMRDEAIGNYHKGYYDSQFALEFGKSRRVHADKFPLTMKIALIAGEYMAEEYHGFYKAKAQNLRHDLSDAYDEAFSEYDILSMPTTPQTAHEYREYSEGEVPEFLTRTANMVHNTSAFNVTGHPAISIPCGSKDGLPIGLTFVGEKFEEEKVLQVASSFESNVFTWT